MIPRKRDVHAKHIRFISTRIHVLYRTCIPPSYLFHSSNTHPPRFSSVCLRPPTVRKKEGRVSHSHGMNACSRPGGEARLKLDTGELQGSQNSSNYTSARGIDSMYVTYLLPGIFQMLRMCITSLAYTRTCRYACRVLLEIWLRMVPQYVFLCGRTTMETWLSWTRAQKRLKTREARSLRCLPCRRYQQSAQIFQ